MRWEKSADQGPLAPGPVAEWGKFTRYLEIGDDGFAIRHVDEFETGRFLRYDRTHWADDFGFLANAQLGKKRSRKSKWMVIIIIEMTEFEKTWTEAGKSAEWKLQVETSQVKRLGSVPPWLILRGT